MPLAVGNKWVYHVEVFDTFSVIQEYDDSIAIISDTTINSESWFRDQKSRLFTNYDDGLYQLISGTPRLWIKFPGDVGDTFTTAINLFNPYEEYGPFRVMTDNVAISVPAGSFPCWQYQRSICIFSGGGTANYYFSPYTGLIRFEHNSTRRCMQEMGTPSASGRLLRYELH
jgi:hypothetical protein